MYETQCTGTGIWSRNGNGYTREMRLNQSENPANLISGSIEKILHSGTHTAVSHHITGTFERQKFINTKF